MADFLKIVKSTHQSLLSDDVLAHFNETKNPRGTFTDKAKFSLKKTVEQPATLFTEQEAADNASELDRVRAENERLSGMVDALREQFKIISRRSKAEWKPQLFFSNKTCSP